MATHRVNDKEIALPDEGYRGNVIIARSCVIVLTTFWQVLNSPLRSELGIAGPLEGGWQREGLLLLSSFVAFLGSGLLLGALTSKRNRHPESRSSVSQKGTEIATIHVQGTIAANRFLGGIPFEGVVAKSDSYFSLTGEYFTFQVPKSRIDSWKWESGSLKILIGGIKDPLRNLITLRTKGDARAGKMHILELVQTSEGTSDCTSTEILPPLTVRTYGFTWVNTWDILLWSIPVNFVIWFLFALSWLGTSNPRGSVSVAVCAAFVGLIMGSVCRAVALYYEVRHARRMAKLGFPLPKDED